MTWGKNISSPPVRIVSPPTHPPAAARALFLFASLRAGGVTAECDSRAIDTNSNSFNACLA